jgi:hypothetical protein
MLSVSMAECLYAECRYAEWRYAECLYAECLYAECLYAKCLYAECLYAECLYAAECHNAEWRYIMLSVVYWPHHHYWPYWPQLSRRWFPTFLGLFPIPTEAWRKPERRHRETPAVQRSPWTWRYPHRRRKHRLTTPGNTNWRGRISTIDLLIRVTCFVTKMNNIYNTKAADLN